MIKILKTFLITGPLFTGVFLWSSLDVAHARQPILVNCESGKSVQAGVNSAKSGDTVFLFGGTCVGDVTITTDDITLSGNKYGLICDQDDPSASAGATINGTITVDGVRARIEHLVITGSGAGVDIVNRAAVALDCNAISDNQKSGIAVIQSSHALLTNNTVSGNGARRFTGPRFYDCGILVLDASAVTSVGNTYEDNDFCAIEVDRQSAFKSGGAGFGGDPFELTQRDFIIARDCDFDENGEGCFSNLQDTVAVELFNGGLADLRNVRVGGQILAIAGSSIRVDTTGEVKGNILAQFNSIVRIRSRQPSDPRIVTYEGTLTCQYGSRDWFSSVQCGQTCSGSIPGSC